MLSQAPATIAVTLEPPGELASAGISCRTATLPARARGLAGGVLSLLGSAGAAESWRAGHDRAGPIWAGAGETVELARRPAAAAHAGADAVMGQVLAWLHRAVGYDAARALAYDPDAMMPVSFAASDRLDWDHAATACWNAHAEADTRMFRELARSKTQVTVLTADSRRATRSADWQGLLLPGSWQHELRAAVVDGHGHCWGALTAFRDGPRPFSSKEAAHVSRELNQIAARLSRALVGGPSPRPSGSAASLWLSDAGELLSATLTGRDWLARLQTPLMPRRADAVLAGLTARIAAAGSHPAAGPVGVRLRGTQGQWVALHGERITAAGGEAQGIAVVVGPARPAVLLPLLAAAYGLTPRERDVISGVLAGLSTRQISSRLRITTYTVQDHLKAIFAKLGVTSRGELAHHLAFQFI